AVAAMVVGALPPQVPRLGRRLTKRIATDLGWLRLRGSRLRGRLRPHEHRPPLRPGRTVIRCRGRSRGLRVGALTTDSTRARSTSRARSFPAGNAVHAFRWREREPRNVPLRRLDVEQLRGLAPPLARADLTNVGNTARTHVESIQTRRVLRVRVVSLDRDANVAAAPLPTFFHLVDDVDHTRFEVESQVGHRIGKDVAIRAVE